MLPSRKPGNTGTNGASVIPPMWEWVAGLLAVAYRASIQRACVSLYAQTLLIISISSRRNDRVRTVVTNDALHASVAN